MTHKLLRAWIADPNALYTTNLHVKELLAERDALAERADALHKALREEVVGGNDEYVGCALCNGGWRYGEPESHAPDCLATPSAPKGPQQTTGKGTE